MTRRSWTSEYFFSLLFPSLSYYVFWLIFGFYVFFLFTYYSYIVVLKKFSLKIRGGGGKLLFYLLYPVYSVRFVNCAILKERYIVDF